MLRRIASLTVALVVWQAAAVAADSVIFPSPLACLDAARLAIADGSLEKNTLASLRRVGVGFSLAALLGVVLGSLSGILGTMGLGFRDVLELLRPIPPIAWVPIAILWLGSATRAPGRGLWARFSHLHSGRPRLCQCPDEHIEVASLEASAVHTLWVRVPAAAPPLLKA